MADTGSDRRPWAGRRVVLVHDWLTGMRGGEKVLASLCHLFPRADLLTLVHARGRVSAPIEARHIRTSFVQYLPGAARLYRQYLPLFPVAIEGFNLDDAELVISTSHCAAKAVVPAGGTPHLCYCHSPMRYAWDQFPHYFGPERVGSAASRLARFAMDGLARWDRLTANRVDRFLANSQYVAGRIARYYNRQASVLYPPVDTDFFTPGAAVPGSYVLVVSALVPYKRLEVVIAAAAQLRVPLRIVGDGPDRARLEAQAGPAVEFLGAVDDDALRDLYRGARVVVMPGEEDFGIVPVEAMACGRPVVARARGGALESVLPDVTGVLVDDDTPAGFAEAIDRVSRLKLDPAVARAQAERFSVPRFEAAFEAEVAGLLGERAPC